MAIANNIIIIWSGAIVNIPDGWFLCDGTNGTPDLRDRFVLGAGNNFNLSDTGGSADAVLPLHNHGGTATTSADGSHNHTFSAGTSFTSSGSNARRHKLRFGGSAGTSGSGAHTHTVTLSNEGEDGTNKNLPPYYALAYIMSGGA